MKRAPAFCLASEILFIPSIFSFLVAAHPRLNIDAVLTAIEFGARALQADILYPLPAA
jgi:hypothetical protein